MQSASLRSFVMVAALAACMAVLAPPALNAQAFAPAAIGPTTFLPVSSAEGSSLPVRNTLATDSGVSSSRTDDGLVDAPGYTTTDEGAAQHFERAPSGRNRGRMSRDPNYGHIGAALSIGASGLTGDLAFPIDRHFDLRLGASGFRYGGTYYADSSDPTINKIPIEGNLQVAYGKVQADYYPFAGHFRISPMLVFANFTHAIAAVQFQGGKEFDFEDGSFISSPTDPVRGYGRVDFRHTAPGLTIGLNNFTRGYGRFTFPVEIGAIYTGAPRLDIQFAGTVCDNTGCDSVQDSPDFQDQLTQVRDRINKDLAQYARFVPVLNIGVGYRFGFNGR